MKTAKTIWLFGLPCSGKTTIAKHLCKEYPWYLRIDGDEIRRGLNYDLGFSKQDRYENIRRIREMAKFLNEKGIYVIVSAITPDEEMRTGIKSIIPESYLVFVDCPIEICKQRDTKGMYKSAELGQIKNFTGIDGVFERPEKYDLFLETWMYTPLECVEKLKEMTSL